MMEKVVRLREERSSLGIFTLVTWGVFPLKGRKRIGPAHFTRRDAAQWVTEQGWRYVGPQEAAR